MKHYKEKRIEIAFIKESGYDMSELINREETIGVYVYLDTVYSDYDESENNGDNMCILVLPKEYVKKYVAEHTDFNSFEEWLNEYTCDDTEDLYDKVIRDGIKYELKGYRWKVCQEQK